MSTPTQSKHPARAVIRTVFSFVAALALVIPVVVSETGVDTEALPWLGAIVAVAAAVTRVLAVPAVNDFLQKWVFTSWLAAQPAEEDDVYFDGHGG